MKKICYWKKIKSHRIINLVKRFAENEILEANSFPLRSHKTKLCSHPLPFTLAGVVAHNRVVETMLNTQCCSKIVKIIIHFSLYINNDYLSEKKFDPKTYR